MFCSWYLQRWHSVREVFETPGSRHVANLLVREGLAVAAAEGVNIPSEEADHILQKVTSPTDHPDLLSLHIDHLTYSASILTILTYLAFILTILTYSASILTILTSTVAR